MGSRWDRDPQESNDEWDDWERDDAGGNARGASSRAGQGGRGNQPAYPQRSYPANPQRSYPQQQRYQSSNWQAAPARVGTGRQAQVRKQGGAQRVIGAIIILLALVGGIGGYVERNHIKALLNRAPAATAGPTLVLPAFADWRVAYLGQDGQLHAVSLDGQTDSAGLGLPSLVAAGTPVASSSAADTSDGAYASPDGHYLVYGGANGPEVLHLTANQGDADAARSDQSAPAALLWSPDSTHLAGLASDGSIHLIDLTLADTKIPATAGAGIQEILGWIDTGHLAVRVDKSGATSEVVASLDIASGAQHTIISLAKPGYGTLRYSLSPDGAHLFVWNTAVNAQPFTAIFRNYDTKTGSVHKLPNSLNAVGKDVSAVVWQPGTQKAALSSGGAAHNAKLWLMDAAADSATAVGANVYPLGWLPDGTQLIAGSALTPSAGGGPYTLSTFIFASSATPNQVTLTTKAMTFPWLGLVKTA